MKKERAIMIASSVFVLAALTMTGVYVKQNSSSNKNDGYSIDFSALESETEKEKREPESSQAPENKTAAQPRQTSDSAAQAKIPKQNMVNMDDALDYYPPLTEADSGEVKIPGLTMDGEDTEQADAAQTDAESREQQTLADEAAMAADAAKADADKRAAAPKGVETNGQALQGQAKGSYMAGESLVWPVNGNVLIPYSMDKTVFFATLDQYKYNPALVVSASEGDFVSAAAAGVVKAVFYDEEIGNAVRIDMGNGYEAVYGQLKDVQVETGNTVEKGSVLGSIAAPTIYYSMEGCNAYFALEKDGVPVDPLGALE